MRRDMQRSEAGPWDERDGRTTMACVLQLQAKDLVKFSLGCLLPLMRKLNELESSGDGDKARAVAGTITWQAGRTCTRDLQFSVPF